MKVVFLENVEGTAQVGDVKDVKNGFARNFLLPRGLAAPAVEPYLAKAQAGARREAKRQDALDKESSELAERLEGQRITMTARVGEQGKLYGSITAVHIAQEVATLIGAEEFDHRKVLLPEAIKETGTQPVRLRLTRNVEATIEVDVLAEGAEEEAVASHRSQTNRRNLVSRRNRWTQTIRPSRPIRMTRRSPQRTSDIGRGLRARSARRRARANGGGARG
jgi:large subunit ribosomal protein L9